MSSMRLWPISAVSMRLYVQEFCTFSYAEVHKQKELGRSWRCALIGVGSLFSKKRLGVDGIADVYTVWRFRASCELLEGQEEVRSRVGRWGVCILIAMTLPCTAFDIER
eukprot:824871-Pelagomonas_calceolata.AAC.2